MNITQITQDVKTGATVAGGTTATGVGTWFEYIPSDIGKLATVIGLVLSLVLIYVHLRKGRLERDILKERLKKLQKL
jgi:hypothetical protein